MLPTRDPPPPTTISIYDPRLRAGGPPPTPSRPATWKGEKRNKKRNFLKCGHFPIGEYKGKSAGGGKFGKFRHSPIGECKENPPEAGDFEI